MGKRTSIILDARQEYAIKNLMDSRECSMARAISLLIDGGLREHKTAKLLEVVSLKTFFLTSFVTHTMDKDAIRNLDINYENSEKQALMQMFEDEIEIE